MKTKTTPKTKTAPKLDEPCPKCGGWLISAGLDADAICTRCFSLFGERPPPDKKPSRPSALDSWLSDCGGVTGALRQTPAYRLLNDASGCGARLALPSGEGALLIEFVDVAGVSTYYAVRPERMEFIGRDAGGERWAAIFKAERVVRADGKSGFYTPRFPCRVSRVEADDEERAIVAKLKSKAAALAANVEAEKGRTEKAAAREALREAADAALVELAKSGAMKAPEAPAKPKPPKREPLPSTAVEIVARLWQNARLHGLPHLKTPGRRVTYKDFFSAYSDDLRAKGVEDVRDVERAVDVATNRGSLPAWNRHRKAKKARLAGNSPETPVKR